MTALVIRRLLIDLDSPFERHWNGGDAFRTAFFNALSMSFPVGEQFFIDSLRTGMQALPNVERARFEADVRGFVGQEATHRRIHALFNRQLDAQGHRNTWEVRARRRIERLNAVPDPRHAVAATAATEHLTAILAEHLLAYPEVLAGAPERLVTMWLWHAAEESEHRSVAFDLHRALGGDETWRRRWMRIVTVHFLTDLARQTLRNLRHDGELLRWRTWTSGARFLFGRHGALRLTFAPWRAYFRRDFHPSGQGGERGVAWLATHTDAYRPVSSAAPAA